MEIEPDFLSDIKMQNGDLATFERGLNLLEHGMKSKKQVKNYLTDKGYPSICIQKALQKLEDYGYLDDQAYTNEYVRLYGQKDGEKKIRFSLKAKGVSDEKISLALEKYLDQETQFDTCFRLAEKKVKNMELDGKGRQKLFVYLAGRGFSLDIIKSAVNKLESKR